VSPAAIVRHLRAHGVPASIGSDGRVRTGKHHAALFALGGLSVRFTACPVGGGISVIEVRP
jgi:hypothetical protein